MKFIIILKIYLIRQKRKLHFLRKKPPEIFTEIYKKNLWKNKESRSGPGSSLASTEFLRKELEEVFNLYKIKSIVDIGCGDFNWLRLIIPENMKYTGIDLVYKLIQENNNQYGSSNITFIYSDCSKQIPPNVDLIICRDVLVHLTNRDALKVIENIKKSGSKYLLTTSFNSVKNKKNYSGGWRAVNMENAPFNFKKPIIRIKEYIPDDVNYPVKELCMWEINSLP